MLQRSIAVPGYLTLAAAIGLALLWPAGADAVRYAPLLLGLVIFGLPHGAVDHHVPARLGATLPPRALILGYLAVAGAGIALWFVAPGVALGLFLVVAAAHWGSGDLWFARHVSGRAAFGRPWRAVAFAVARGLLVVLLPLLVYPAAAAEGTGAVLSAMGAGSGGWTPGGSLRVAGLALVGVTVAAAVLASRLDHRGTSRLRGQLIDVGELVLLALTMVLVPPVFAVGVYFVAWHSPRHVARLMACDPSQARLLAAGRVRAALVAWHREAAPLTAVSLAGLALMAALVWRVPVRADAITGSALGLIAALTLPHAAVVAWMDRVQLAPQRDQNTRSAAGAVVPAGLGAQIDRAATSSLRQPGTTARPAATP